MDFESLFHVMLEKLRTNNQVVPRLKGEGLGYFYENIFGALEQSPALQHLKDLGGGMGNPTPD